MPTTPRKAKLLLKENKAKVTCKLPFTIKLAPCGRTFDFVTKIANSYTIKLSDIVLHKKHVAAGDYQQNKGAHSEKKIPTGKLFGLKKFDLVITSKGIGFIKGKRSSGYFALMDIFNNTVTASVNVKKNCQRLRARTTTIIQEGGNSSPTLKG